jgi:hypothetical protein
MAWRIGTRTACLCHFNYVSILDYIEVHANKNPSRLQWLGSRHSALNFWLLVCALPTRHVVCFYLQLYLIACQGRDRIARIIHSLRHWWTGKRKLFYNIPLTKERRWWGGDIFSCIYVILNLRISRVWTFCRKDDYGWQIMIKPHEDFHAALAW